MGKKTRQKSFLFSFTEAQLDLKINLAQSVGENDTRFALGLRGTVGLACAHSKWASLFPEHESVS